MYIHSFKDKHKEDLHEPFSLSLLLTSNFVSKKKN